MRDSRTSGFSRRSFVGFSLAAVAGVAGCRSGPKVPVINLERHQEKFGDRPVRIACVGDSITYGAGVENREKNHYPAILGELLGSSFEVRNFGRSGATLALAGDLPYVSTEEFRAGNAYEPDVVILMLGTNDTKPHNWKGAAAFEADLKTMLEHYRELKSKPRIWVCLPVPVYGDQWGITAATLDGEVIPAILKVCSDRKTPVIDLHDALSRHPEVFPDKIHPNAAGANLMARTIYQAIRP